MGQFSVGVAHKYPEQRAAGCTFRRGCAAAAGQRAMADFDQSEPHAAAPAVAAVAAAVLLLAGMWGFLGMHVMGLLQLPASRLAGAPGAAALLEQAQA